MDNNRIMPDNQSVYFSIIVPVYNKEKYIDRAILSILNQDFQDFELIIVNDGSTDNTVNIINKYLKQSSKIVLVNHLKNESLHMARMDGVAAANGKYILFLDGDDYFAKNAFSILYDETQKSPEYDFYEYGYIERPSGRKKFYFYSGDDRFSAYFEKENCPVHTMWNKVYETKLLKKAFNEMEKIYLNNTEDTYESIVITFFLKKTIEIKKIITNYQIYTGISTTYKDYDKTVRLLKDIKLMISLVGNFLDKNDINISLDDIKYRFLASAIFNHINSQKNRDDMKNLFFILPEYFDIKIILGYLFYKEESCKEIALIANSKKLGFIIKKLIQFRRMKTFIRKSIFKTQDSYL
jgi:glycosyltransferase involved in cell wall biosynthesis